MAIFIRANRLYLITQGEFAIAEQFSTMRPQRFYAPTPINAGAELRDKT